MHRKRKTRVCYTFCECCNWKRADHSRGVKQSGFIWNLKQRRILQNLVTTTSGKEFSEFDKQTKTCFHLLTPQKVIFFPPGVSFKILGLYSWTHKSRSHRCDLSFIHHWTPAVPCPHCGAAWKLSKRTFTQGCPHPCFHHSVICRSGCSEKSLTQITNGSW